MKKITVKAELFILVAALIFSLVGCGGDKMYGASASVQETAFSVSVSVRKGDKTDFSDDELAALFEDACAAFDAAYSYLEPFGGDTVLEKINSDVDVLLDCDAELLGVLDRAVRLRDMTDGAYEPCCGAYTKLLYSGDADAETLTAAVEHTGSQKIQWDGAQVNKSDRAAAFDLYAVREGYALEAAVKTVSDSGSAYGTVSAGNAVAVFGEKPKGERFNIAVPDEDGDALGWFCVPGGYVVAVDSDTALRDGEEFKKIAVYAADGMTAGAVADAIWLGGDECFSELCQAMQGSFAAVTVNNDGEVTVSDGAAESGLFVLRESDVKK